VITPKAPGELACRRRGRHPPRAAKVGAGTVAAQLLDVIKALAADQLGLRERQQQLATGHPARTDFDRRSAALPGKLPVDQPDKPQRSREPRSPRVQQTEFDAHHQP